MVARQRTVIQIAGAREGAALVATLGGQIREGRTHRRLSQDALGRLVGLSPARISGIEHGDGAGVPLGTWIALGIALRTPLAARLTKPLSPDALGPGDAAHLAMQEVILAYAAATRREGTFELPTRPADPSRSIDVCIRDERNHCLTVVEIWNDFRDLGSAGRSFKRKLAEAEALAVAIGSGRSYRVAGCWVIRPSAQNRGLIARYPHVFESLLPGSSAAWVQTLVGGTEPPGAPGLT
jgi:transcriptional regulator with XRE-family HTH domain